MIMPRLDSGSKTGGVVGLEGERTLETFCHGSHFQPPFLSLSRFNPLRKGQYRCEIIKYLCKCPCWTSLMTWSPQIGLSGD